MSESKFVIIKTGGKQYKVSEGTKLRVEKLPAKDGKDIIFKEILLYVDGRGVDVGTPHVLGVSVVGRALGQGKADKVIIYKKKKRKRYEKKKGHRQPYTEIEIVEIKKGAGEKSPSATKEKKPAVKTKTALKKKAS